MRSFENKNIETLYSAEDLQNKAKELGAQIAKDYGDRTEELTVIGVLKGSFIFLADLVRAIDLPLNIDFIGVSSYGDGTESSGKITITHPLSKPITGKDIIVVEDIVDTGLTMKALLELFEESKPASVKVCTLLEKPERRQVTVQMDYVGFSIPDKFVLGYGLDLAGRFRNLPFVGVNQGDA
ncbi:MAG: hypoxanthine phosphoribosyltransferase [Myxococcales bacterium]|nr:hypoxanthine phosphoribosyltransferase [Myxococcales bacterium]|tara:strand:- start:180 stop:725 length:546 start_codon:yes stop_codon:yes gene_type:complete